MYKCAWRKIKRGTIHRDESRDVGLVTLKPQHGQDIIITSTSVKVNQACRKVGSKIWPGSPLFSWRVLQTHLSVQAGGERGTYYDTPKRQEPCKYNMSTIILWHTYCIYLLFMCSYRLKGAEKGVTILSVVFNLSLRFLLPEYLRSSTRIRNCVQG